MTRRILSLLVVMLLTTAASCNYFIVGDDTAAQVRLVSGEGLTQTGCGFTTETLCQIPLQNLPSSINEDIVVSFISIHDRVACTEVTEGVYDCSAAADDYVSAHSTLEALGVPVIWVEVPPIIGDPDHPYNPILAELNNAISVALGCDLAPASYRFAQSSNGIHYTTSGYTTVAMVLSLLNEDDAC